jgi:predicted DNA-binding transcriptional regulator AlpA
MACATKQSLPEEQLDSDHQPISPIRFIPIGKVRDISGRSVPSIYRGVANRTFPSPVKVGRSSRWVESEIIDWCAARIAERDSEAS